MSNQVTRRQLLCALALAAPAASVAETRARPLDSAQDRPTTTDAPLGADVLPRGVRARFVDNVNGIRMHVLDAGFTASSGSISTRPAILLVHGFPELAYSWRKVMLPLAAAGYRVIAPDQRGYGRTTGWDGDYGGDLASFRILNAVRDALGLVSALGYHQVSGVFGHD